MLSQTVGLTLFSLGLFASGGWMQFRYNKTPDFSYRMGAQWVTCFGLLPGALALAQIFR